MRRELCARKERLSVCTPSTSRVCRSRTNRCWDAAVLGCPLTGNANLWSRAGAAKREAHWAPGPCDTAHIVEVWVGGGELSSISSRLRTRQSWGRLREGWDSSCCWGQAQGSSTATSRAGEEVLSFQCVVQKVKAFPYRIYDYRGQLFLLHYQLTGRKKKRKKTKPALLPSAWLPPSSACAPAHFLSSSPSAVPAVRHTCFVPLPALLCICPFPHSGPALPFLWVTTECSKPRDSITPVLPYNCSHLLLCVLNAT